MCFSATASFTAAAVMGGVGLATFKISKNKDQRYLASVPFLFAWQQLSEAWVWISIRDEQWHPYQHFFTLCFLFFAWVVWPILIPLSFYKIEPNSIRKLWCKRLVYVGICSAAYASFNMLMKYPVPDVATFHIVYTMEKLYQHDLFFVPHQIVYVLSTVLPMFLSTLKGVKFLAIVNFIALIFCFYLFQLALPSTWCFFAAFISAIIYWIIKQVNSNQSLSTRS